MAMAIEFLSREEVIVSLVIYKHECRADYKEGNLDVNL